MRARGPAFFDGPTPAFLAALRAETNRQLDALLLQIHASAATSPAGWHAGSLLHGLAADAASRTGLSPAPFAARLCQELLVELSKDRTAAKNVFPRNIDDCMAGWALLELAEQTTEHDFACVADRLARYLLEDCPRTGGLLPYRNRRPRLMLVDTLGIASPLLVRYGSKNGRTDAVELGVRQITDFIDKNLDLMTGLPFHAYEMDGNRHLGLVAWSRGIGWLMVGLADTLLHLAPEHASRDKLSDAFRQLTSSLRALQRDDGSWGWIASLSHSPPDSSGTAMIGYAIARGVQLDILEPSLAEVARRALSAVACLTRIHGVVDQANAECQGIGVHPAKFGPSSAAQGFALSLAAACGLEGLEGDLGE